MSATPRGYEKKREGTYIDHTHNGAERRIQIFAKKNGKSFAVHQLDKYERPDEYQVKQITSPKHGRKDVKLLEDNIDSKREAIEEAQKIMESKSSSSKSSSSSGTVSEDKIQREVKNAVEKLGAHEFLRTMTSPIQYEQEDYDMTVASTTVDGKKLYAVDGNVMNERPDTDAYEKTGDGGSYPGFEAEIEADTIVDQVVSKTGANHERVYDVMEEMGRSEYGSVLYTTVKGRINHYSSARSRTSGYSSSFEELKTKEEGTKKFEKVGDYKNHNIYMFKIEGTEGKMGFPAVDPGIRVMFENKDTGASREFPVKSSNFNKAMKKARQMVDWVYQEYNEPEYSEGQNVDTKYGGGKITDISYYNNPFAKELPVEKGKYPVRYSYTVDTGSKKYTQLEKQLRRKN